jgi:ABC-type transport system substrate-binding protein
MFSSFSDNPDIAKLEVRKALNMAIDKARLMQAATFGFATENKIACHPSMQGCDVEVEQYAYDPDAAKAALEAAGFDFSQAIKIVVPASDGNPTIAQGIAQFFQRIGVKTELEAMESGAYVAMTSAKPKDPSIDIIMEGYPDYNRDPSGRLRRLLYTGETISFVTDPDLDAMIDELTGFTTEEDRLAHIRKIFRMVHEKVSMINLWSADVIYGTTNKIEWEPAVSAWPVFWNVRKTAS